MDTMKEVLQDLAPNARFNRHGEKEIVKNLAVGAEAKKNFVRCILDDQAEVT